MNNEIIDIIENHDVNALRNWLYRGGDPNFFAGRNEHKIALIQHVLHEMDGPETDQVVSEMLQILIDKGADVNIHSEDRYPLLHAVEEQSPLIVKILLEANANVNIKDKTGETPLTSAVIDENVEILKLLLEYTDKDSIDEIGSIWVKSPLGIAFRKVNLEIIELLLKNGANPFLLDWDNGNIPMIENTPTTHLRKKILVLVEKYYPTNT